MSSLTLTPVEQAHLKSVIDLVIKQNNLTTYNTKYTWFQNLGFQVFKSYLTMMGAGSLANRLNQANYLNIIKPYLGQIASTDLILPTSPNSTWQQYIRKFENKFGKEDAQRVSEDVQETLDSMVKTTVGYRWISKLDLNPEFVQNNELLDNTTFTKNDFYKDKYACRGMVYGKVQSGKTAHMTGLITAAGSQQNKFNLFIVLSGVWNVLREQTVDRLKKDITSLGNTDEVFTYLPEINNTSTDTLFSLTLDSTSNKRYLNVTIKQISRLKDLLNWFKSTNGQANLKKVRVVIIDDEADQASINSNAGSDSDNEGNEEDIKDRTAINRALVNLLEFLQLNAESVQYIAYTATPYSCFLNESLPESLYPQDFIQVLNSSNYYIGAKEVFGHQEANTYEQTLGMDIIRVVDHPEISQTEQEKLTAIRTQKGDLHAEGLPTSLHDAIHWFLCATAAKHQMGLFEPSTLLVHPSHTIGTHEKVVKGIYQYIKNTDKSAILNKCQNIWLTETNKFGAQDFKTAHRQYPTNTHDLNIPSFDKIEPHIKKLLTGTKIAHIEYENDEARFGEHIHLCVNNSGTQPFIPSTTPGLNVGAKLDYPKDNNPKKELRAFIVVGGNTLSRGLTLQGLVASYFLRATSLGDTLMQMARWLGYRVKYELCPRIWMDENTLIRFQELVDLDETLRAELLDYKHKQLPPSIYFPRVKLCPSIIPTSRMNGAQPAENNYSGFKRQNLHFKLNDLKHNYEVTKQFITSLYNGGVASSEYNSRYIRYYDVDIQDIQTFFQNYRMPQDDGSNGPKTKNIFWGDLPKFGTWCEKNIDDSDPNKMNSFNVVVRGLEHSDTNNGIASTPQWANAGISPYSSIDMGWGFYINPLKIGTVEYKPHLDMLSVKAWASTNTLICDVKKPGLYHKKGTLKENEIYEIREKEGLGATPLLIISFIGPVNLRKPSPSKESIDFKQGMELANGPLQTPIVTLRFLIPGEKSGKNNIQFVAIPAI